MCAYGEGVRGVAHRASERGRERERGRELFIDRKGSLVEAILGLTTITLSLLSSSLDGNYTLGVVAMATAGTANKLDHCRTLARSQPALATESSTFGHTPAHGRLNDLAIGPSLLTEQ